MPRTIDEGFRDFLRKLTPSAVETEAARRHRASIESRLKRDFALRRFFRTGSFGNGTSISGYSDVDYFASIPTANLKQNSGVSLRQVKESLADRFPSTVVRVSCPAVEVPFGLLARESTEVVPADYVGKSAGGYRIYEIPDCQAGWMKSSPEAHNAYVRRVDAKHGGKVRPLVRFLKAWKFYRSVPISSFYLELRTAKYADGESAIIYDIDVERVLKFLSEQNLPAIRDPVGISGTIYPCATDVQLKEARSNVARAAKRAQNARLEEARGNTKAAFYWWDLVFDGKFPGYYY